MTEETRRSGRTVPAWARLAGLAALLAAVAAYLVFLGGLHIPHIGDEMPYAQVTRLTAESGHLLPLQAEEGLENTKPPLLFWTGIVATNWGRVWTLLRLRLPIVLVTFLIAAAVYALTRRLAGRPGPAVVAALSFLGFWTTFQYGRPFLTNMPETLFVFLPFAAALAGPYRVDRWSFWGWTGLSVGIACLFKSFALVVPVGFAWSWWLLRRRRYDVATFLRHDVPKGLLALVLALACFGLWPLLDPDPRSIFDQFVWKENVGKLGGAGWLAGLVSSSHGLHTTLLGWLFNAGFLALPLAWVAWRAAREPHALRSEERALWILVAAFVIVYTLPDHRQSNYLLPVMPALAVLLGLAWNGIGLAWLRISAIPLAAVGVGALAFILAMGLGALPSFAWTWWQVAIPLVTLIAGAVAIHVPRATRYVFHLAVFLALLSIGAAVAPFDGPLGRYDLATQRRLADETVYVPSTFRSRYERWRFLLPWSRIRGYDPRDPARRDALLAAGHIVAWTGPPGGVLPGAEGATGYEYGRRLDLRTRQSAEEIRALVLEQKLDVLLQEEIILEWRPREGGAIGEDG